MTKHTINDHEYDYAEDTGAVFMNGIQILIPIQGANVLQEMYVLWDHLMKNDDPTLQPLEEQFREAHESADPDAVASLDTVDAIPGATCNSLHESGVAACDLPVGHEGRHHGWMAPGDVSDGMDDITWPQRQHLYWKGFNVVNVDDGVNVSHEALPNEVFGFRGRRDAANVASIAYPAEGALNSLPALAALAWFNEFRPEWTLWEPGETVVRDDGLNGFVVSNEDGAFLVASTGRFVRLEAEQESELKRWRSE